MPIALIQGLLALVPMALQAYAEIRGSLSAQTQAEVDALIDQIKPQALAAVDHAKADLAAAAQR